MSEKDLMGTMSPAYGMATGHGAFGAMADAGIGGVIPSMLAQDRKDKKQEEEAKKMGTAMKNGGSVSASSRADGCAIRGKTKGKIV
jgi:hypothetical protein